MKYEVFNPDHDSMGFFDTINDHPGCAQRVFAIALEGIIKEFNANTKSQFCWFEHTTDKNILNSIITLTDEKRKDALFFYFKKV